MKTALVLFRSPLAPFDAQRVEKLTQALSQNGFPVHTIKILSFSDCFGFKASIEEFKQTFDTLVIAYNQQVEFDLKKTLADQTQTTLLENENALKILQELGEKHGKEYSKDNALIPMEATLIPNPSGEFQGFLLDDSDFTMVVLPDEIAEFSNACENYLAPYSESKAENKNQILTFKYFGAKLPLDKAIENAVQNAEREVEVSTECVNGDWTIRFMCSTQDANGIARDIIQDLKEDIYAEFSTDLGERLFDLLRLRKLKLATAESFTGGRVVSSVIKNVGASSFVHEGIVAYSNQSKAHRLNINEGDILKDGAVSSMTAYRMAAGLLKGGKVDLAIATTGYAGPKTQGSDEPVGLCYVAIGMMDGVHTYKLNLSGSREEITETAKNTALFLAIKKLKSIK
jgi:nicotinamide-nucleotide amidase